MISNSISENFVKKAKSIEKSKSSENNILSILQNSQLQNIYQTEEQLRILKNSFIITNSNTVPRKKMHLSQDFDISPYLITRKNHFLENRNVKAEDKIDPIKTKLEFKDDKFKILKLEVIKSSQSLTKAINILKKTQYDSDYFKKNFVKMKNIEKIKRKSLKANINS